MKKIQSSYKKASIVDYAYLIVFLFAFVVIVLIGNMVLSKVIPALNQSATEQGLSNETLEIINLHSSQSYASLFDVLFLVAMIGVSIAVIVGAFMINTHPAFFFISLFFIVFMIIISAMLSNAYEAVSTNAEIAESASNYQIIPYILDNFPYFALLLGALISIVMYARGRTE